MSVLEATVLPAVDDSLAVDQRMPFVDAALNVAGLQLTDPSTRGLVEAVAAGQLSEDDAATAVVNQIKNPQRG